MVAEGRFHTKKLHKTFKTIYKLKYSGAGLFLMDQVAARSPNDDDIQNNKNRGHSRNCKYRGLYWLEQESQIKDKEKLTS